MSVFYFARGSGCEVLWWVGLCLSVCLPVCLSARISPEPHARSLPNFCACCLCPWLGPPSMFTIRRIAYSREGVFLPIENALSARERGMAMAVHSAGEVCYLRLLVKSRLHDTACCQTGCQTGLTTGCIVYTKLQTFNRLSNRLYNRLDNRLYRVNGYYLYHIFYFLGRIAADRCGLLLQTE